jgi:hypothetical protein
MIFWNILKMERIWRIPLTPLFLILCWWAMNSGTRDPTICQRDPQQSSPESSHSRHSPASFRNRSRPDSPDVSPYPPGPLADPWPVSWDDKSWLEVKIFKLKVCYVSWSVFELLTLAVDIRVTASFRHLSRDFSGDSAPKQLSETGAIGVWELGTIAFPGMSTLW